MLVVFTLPGVIGPRSLNFQSTSFSKGQLTHRKNLQHQYSSLASRPIDQGLVLICQHPLTYFPGIEEGKEIAGRVCSWLAYCVCIERLYCPHIAWIPKIHAVKNLSMHGEVMESPASKLQLFHIGWLLTISEDHLQGL